MSVKAPSAQHVVRRSILDLEHDAARTFLLRPQSYCTLDLPPYIVFGDLINAVHRALDGKMLSDLSSNPRDHDDVNYTILHNKDGKYAWRPFQLIHPALYVSLVHAITEKQHWNLIRDRFREFLVNDQIRCLSLPVVPSSDEKDRAAQISHWWHEIEQRSVELSLDYNYLIETDIVDCYGAIYTHSVAWALHTKDEAKKNRTNQQYIGNVIDRHIQDMRHGQTNGISQGSVLMDLIAEMVLGLADLELSGRLQNAGITDYQILRYRDDYRVFANSLQIGETIIKSISETTTTLGLKLNPAKTRMSNDVVRCSIKCDKLAWMARKQSDKNLQQHLLIIHDHAINFPNAGSLVVALNHHYKRISNVVSPPESPLPLIAIVADIAYRNPRTYAICTAIMSKLLEFIGGDDEKLAAVERIRKKFSQITNTGHMQIWLQRVTLPFARNIDYDETICKLVLGGGERLWNSDWITWRDLKNAVDAAKIIDASIRDTMTSVISPKEVELFSSGIGGYYG